MTKSKVMKIVDQRSDDGRNVQSLKSASALGCPKKTKSLNFVTQLTPVVFIG